MCACIRVCVFYFDWDRVYAALAGQDSLCRPGWSQNHGNPLASASWALGREKCVTLGFALHTLGDFWWPHNDMWLPLKYQTEKLHCPEDSVLSCSLIQSNCRSLVQFLFSNVTQSEVFSTQLLPLSGMSSHSVVPYSFSAHHNTWLSDCATVTYPFTYWMRVSCFPVWATTYLLYIIPFHAWMIFHCMDIPHLFIHLTDGHWEISSFWILQRVFLWTFLKFLIWVKAEPIFLFFGSYGNSVLN